MNAKTFMTELENKILSMIEEGKNLKYISKKNYLKKHDIIKILEKMLRKGLI